MARQERTCWRCGAGWEAESATPPVEPPARLYSLRARTRHVLDTRAGRRAESARRDRRSSGVAAQGTAD
jgi:hypothetical protein